MEAGWQLEEERSDFQPIRVETDMALEARDIVRGTAHQEIPGVKVTERKLESIRITHVEILEEEAERLMGKPRGHYTTLDVPRFKERDPDLKRRLISAVKEALVPMLPESLQATVLVVGLGNWNATPDALGPRTVDRILVTRHLGTVVPDAIRTRMRPVAAVAPGVLGTTGIETVDIIRGVVNEVRPDLILAVDALAARNLERLVGSVQIADTGIHPGSGVGNRRQGLNQASLGVPVAAIGVCTVVQSISIAEEAVHLLANQLADEVKFYEILKQMAEPEQRGLIDEVLGRKLGDLMVTPKEIDLLIDDMADVLGEALNQALQPRLEPSEWA